MRIPVCLVRVFWQDGGSVVCLERIPKTMTATAPLMPRATAVWLIEHTSLTFEQISAFCHLHLLEVQALADDGDILGVSPLTQGQLTQDEIDRCQKDPGARLVLSPPVHEDVGRVRTGRRYTPLTRRQDKPDGIAWILKHHPELTDAQIIRLLSTTRPTITAIRERTHPQAGQIKARHPVHLGLCSAAELEQEVKVSWHRRADALAAAPRYPDEDDFQGH